MRSKHGFETTCSRSYIMSRIKSIDTKPEIKFRKALWNLGFRYRKNYKKLPGCPDIVFVSKKIAIFIDGDFWHGRNWRSKKNKIQNNRSYWIRKIENNMKRDKKNNRALKKLGWTVFRYWESDVINNINFCLVEVISSLNKN